MQSSLGKINQFQILKICTQVFWKVEKQFPKLQGQLKTANSLKLQNTKRYFLNSVVFCGETLWKWSKNISFWQLFCKIGTLLGLGRLSSFENNFFGLQESTVQSLKSSNWLIFQSHKTKWKMSLYPTYILMLTRKLTFKTLLKNKDLRPPAT